VIGPRRPHTLIGRRREQQILADLLDEARRGHSGVLVIRGEIGIGKTTLLSSAVADASDLRVMQISGAESEMELPFAGVQQLCTPLPRFIDRLPDPQKNALQVSFGLRTGEAPDRLLVGLAVLTLLGEASGEGATVCVIDDAQWLDTASLQALAVVARRVIADPWQ
jgi:predicted ATPase